MLLNWTRRDAPAAYGVLQGMDVPFDQIPSNVARDEDAEVMCSIETCLSSTLRATPYHPGLAKSPCSTGC